MGNRAFRTISLTEKGMEAIADLPVRTWDEVIKDAMGLPAPARKAGRPPANRPAP